MGTITAEEAITEIIRIFRDEEDEDCPSDVLNTIYEVIEKYLGHSS